MSCNIFIGHVWSKPSGRGRIARTEQDGQLGSCTPKEVGNSFWELTHEDALADGHPATNSRKGGMIYINPARQAAL